MKRFLAPLLAGFALLAPLLVGPAHAQTDARLYCYQGPTNPQWAPCNAGNPLSVNASVSASITGFPGSTQTTGTPIAVTTGGVTGTLPAGSTVVVASNVGATNGAYCKLGASATTSDQLIPPNSWFSFTVGTNTQLTCITSTSTTTVNMVGGSGLPTGTGGGGGGGSGGSVTQGTSPWVDNITQIGGSTLTIGQQLAAASIPVILPAATITTLTPPTSVTVTQATGTNLHAVLDTTSTTAVTQATGTNLHTVVDSAVGLAQGSTTSGQTGSMIMGAVTTSPPTNTTAQTAYASLATTGGLRIAGDGTKLLVTPDSVALPANQSVNVAQFGGVATTTGQVAVSTAPVTATNTALVVDLRPDSPGIITLGPATVANSVPFTFSSQYPTNATTTTPTAVTATATGTTAATAATLGATASVTNFVCGFTITADATALATGTATLSGTISGSMNYLQTIVAVTNGTSQLTQNFSPCIPASAANTAITITSAAAGTGGNTIVNIWGYRL